MWLTMVFLHLRLHYHRNIGSKKREWKTPPPPPPCTIQAAFLGDTVKERYRRPGISEPSEMLKGHLSDFDSKLVQKNEVETFLG